MKQIAYQNTSQPVFLLSGCDLEWVNKMTNEPSSMVENPNQVRLRAALRRRELSQKKEEAKRLWDQVI